MAEGTQHPITDAGRRMSEGYADARRQGGQGRWIAVDLATGQVAGRRGKADVYDTRADAVRHNNEARFCFAQVGPMDMPPAEATAWIDLHRRTWKAGFRFTDPGGTMPLPPLGPLATTPRPGLRPSGLLIPDVTRRARRRGRDRR